MTRNGSRRGSDRDKSFTMLNPFAVLISGPSGVAKRHSLAGFNPLGEPGNRSFIVIDPKGESGPMSGKSRRGKPS